MNLGWYAFNFLFLFTHILGFGMLIYFSGIILMTLTHSDFVGELVYHISDFPPMQECKILV